MTYESLSSALGDLETQTQMLGQLDAQDVRVVNVESIMSTLDGTQRQRLRKMYRNVEMEALRDAIENSPTLVDALKNESGTQVDARDVVAVDMQDGGEIVAYVDPNSALKGRGTDDVQQQEDEWQDRDTSAVDGRQQWDAQKQGRDTSETQGFEQREAQERDRDSSDAGNVQQHAQPRDRNTHETGSVQQQAAQQQDSQTVERLHSVMHDMKTHTQALTRSGAQETEGQPADERRTETQSVRVVHVEDITADLGDEQIQRLRRTYQDAETEALHSALENNEAVMNSLKTNANTELDVSDVVAVGVRDRGETVLYVDPNGELEGDGTGDFE